ncbi:MAG TPA: GNAT family N-acetyltransferase [Elusimicrobiota bacterium]|jgi:RimJ/RimL family protein N-acetyltransferase|nr:GNAT family N-acetyltransferase [Elusimicrobiota bacterium]
MSPEPLDTSRLKLIPATLELADADLHNRMEFSHQLGARVLDSWPPPLNDESSMRWTIDYLRRDPGAAGWAAWYWVAKKHKPVAVGIGGFKGVPASGAVEVGYSLLPEFQRKGYASEAVAALLDWAFAHSEVDRVLARTLPGLAPSIRLLERAGFANVGPGSEPGVLGFELTRAGRAAPRASV